METSDGGETWQSAGGETLKTPLVDKDNAALVREYETEGLLVYMKDMLIRENGDVLILYITSKGYASGPKNDPRIWTVARRSGGKWAFFQSPNRTAITTWARFISRATRSCA